MKASRGRESQVNLKLVNELQGWGKAMSTEPLGNGFIYEAILLESSYLVDPASSHMLVSKIKPCMSKYKQICTVKLRMAH